MYVRKLKEKNAIATWQIAINCIIDKTARHKDTVAMNDNM